MLGVVRLQQLNIARQTRRLAAPLIFAVGACDRA
jgi:hypothetical protein